MASAVLGLAFAAASVGAAGAFAADRPATPEEVYFDALAAMRAIPDPPYLRFDYHYVQVVGTRDHQEDWHAVERTRDGHVRFTDDRGNERPAGSRAGFAYLPPDVFLKPAVASPEQFGIVTDTPYKVIGSTGARTTHYVITDAGGDPVAECPGATHLRLRPKTGGDPLYYNLRELWITPATGRICRAVAVWKLYHFGHPSAVDVLVDLDAQTGLVNRYTTAGEFGGLFAAHYRLEGRYANLTPESSEPAGLSE